MNDDGGMQIPVRMIGEHRKRIQNYRRKIQRELADNNVSGELHDDFAVEVLGYFDVLREFRNADAIDEGDFPDVSPLRSRLGHEVETVTDAGGLGRGKTYKTVPAIREVDLSYLLRVSHELDDVAQTLGFGATAAKKTPHGKATKGDLEALLKTRGQDDAVENLPGGDA